MLRSCRWVLVLLIPLLLWGCTANVRPGSTTVVLRDGAPDEDIDVTDLADAIPREELIRTAGNKTPYTVLGKTYHINFDTRGFNQTGYASWYGKKFHGNKTSNGETYDMYAMTAAHTTLAIPSYVRVTNLENGKQVVVRVNDRGPFHEGRIIDLSYAAAKKLDFHNKGTTKVKIEVVAPDVPAPSTQLASAAPMPVVASAGAASTDSGSTTPMTYLQLGAFSQAESASALVSQVTSATGVPAQVRPEPARRLYKVVIGPILDNIELLTLRQKLADAKLPEPHLVEF